MKRPIYEALSITGFPYERPAKIVGELPIGEVLNALETATLEVAKIIGVQAQRRIPYGAPVYVAFGLDRARAKNHQYAGLLLSKGENLSLELCSMHEPKDSEHSKQLLIKSEPESNGVRSN